MDVTRIKKAFDVLVAYCIGGVMGMDIGLASPERFKGNVVVTDADQDSWSAIVFRIVEAEGDQPEDHGDEGHGRRGGGSRGCQCAKCVQKQTEGRRRESGIASFLHFIHICHYQCIGHQSGEGHDK